MSDIMKDLGFWQRIDMCFWGMNRRMKYFDFLNDGMAQKFAYKKAKGMSKKDVRILYKSESIEGKTQKRREFDKNIGA